MTSELVHLGIKLYGRFHEVDRGISDDLMFIKEMMVKAVHLGNMRIVGETSHKFSPRGVSVGLLLEDSHLNIHTWPEYGYADVDLHSCGNDSKPDTSMTYVISTLNPQAGRVERSYTGILERSSRGLYLPPKSPPTIMIYSLADYGKFVENLKEQSRV